MKKVERWKLEMPTEEEMLPRDKYTVFDRKVKRYRKGIHSKRHGRLDVYLDVYADGAQRCPSGRESVSDSTPPASRRARRRMFPIRLFNGLSRVLHCLLASAVMLTSKFSPFPCALR
jgi:hypothetical protein